MKAETVAVPIKFGTLNLQRSAEVGVIAADLEASCASRGRVEKEGSTVEGERRRWMKR